MFSTILAWSLVPLTTLNRHFCYIARFFFFFCSLNFFGVQLFLFGESLGWVNLAWAVQNLTDLYPCVTEFSPKTFGD